MCNDTSYWGNQTSLYSFCERKYELSPFIAEGTNTLSSSIYIIHGMLGFCKTRDFYISLMYSILILIGIGSILFHATLQYSAEMVDEISMILFLSVSFISKPQNTLSVKIAVCLCTIASITLYAMYQLYSVFLSIFFSMVGFELLFYIRMSSAYEPCCYNAYSALILMSLGLIVWVSENMYCDKFEYVYILHSVWHILSSFGAVNIILLNENARNTKLKYSYKDDIYKNF